ncbi:hypothetical protein COLO4_37563 [Corchorus olitorius]|uniref:Uncharacterized protein n=1 Tax=Corchorus olitorius TaxID=93759 RepID=A0A1R3G0S6_9ROSI|nr:hypothetical protein COLO4_37563 [Corchorus olitorius]
MSNMAPFGSTIAWTSPGIVAAVWEIFPTVDGLQTLSVTLFRSPDSNSDLSFAVGCTDGHENASDSRGKTYTDLPNSPLDRAQTQDGGKWCYLRVVQPLSHTNPLHSSTVVNSLVSYPFYRFPCAMEGVLSFLSLKPRKFTCKFTLLFMPC